MHESVQRNLESLLEAKRQLKATAASGVDGPVSLASSSLKKDITHLQGCAECSREFSDMANQAAWFSNFHADDSLSPSPGFYARVLQTIDQSKPSCVWTALVGSPFGRRVTYAALAAALVIGTYVVTVESNEMNFDNTSVNAAVQDTNSMAPVIGDKAQQREAVLVNLASYGDSIQ